MQGAGRYTGRNTSRDGMPTFVETLVEVEAKELVDTRFETR